MKINSITIKDNNPIAIGKVTVLVGPNNSGKSQTLRDILNLMTSNVNHRILVEDIDFNFFPTFDEETQGLSVTPSKTNANHNTVSGISAQLSSLNSLDFYSPHMVEAYNSGQIRNAVIPTISQFKIAYLNSGTRLALVTETLSFDVDQGFPENILQFLYTHKESEEMLQSAFKIAFGMTIKLDYARLQYLCLRVSGSIPEIPLDPREAIKITKNIPRIDEQGDGFKSFVGIVLALLLSKDRVILLDEPEAFLHPTQARYLGKWIADNIQHFSGQLIISTHNSNFLGGLLAGKYSVDIYRLNRTNDNTQFRLLPDAVTKQLSQDPLLSSQRVLEAIFHKGTVVCEADADRAVYGSVASIEFNNQDVLFIHAHNKQTIKKVVQLLIKAHVPTIAIADIDLLNTEDDFVGLYKTLTNSEIPEALRRLRKEISESVNTLPDDEVLRNLKSYVDEFNNQLERGEHTLSGAKGALERITKTITKWSEVKSKGIAGFEPHIQPAVDNLLKCCNSIGLFILPVGELEGWIEINGIRKKNKWIIPALEIIHKGETPDPLKVFVNEILDCFKDNG
ncbi:ABC-type transport system involved in cytochrome c biogenesis ATPase subunit [Pedobacter africanus]|uniref:ATP-dependent nuclease n=1 Tax=Pedobacter africanus TaxID=151894 RepID=UPI003392883C